MLTLIVVLAVSLTLNVVFVVLLIVAFLHSNASTSPSVSTVNVNVGTENVASKPVPQKTVSIYTLIDPHSGQVKYVGQSVDVEKRITQHVRDAMTTGAMSKWLAELYAENQLPTVKIVESGLTRNQAKTVEQQYIREYIRGGEKLFNKESVNIVPEIMHRIQIDGPEEV